MTRYLAHRPTLTEADAALVTQTIAYYDGTLTHRGPASAELLTATLIEDLLTERQTGIRRPAPFWARAACDHWDAVAEQVRPTAERIAGLLRCGCWEDAGAMLAAALEATADTAAASR